MFLSPTRNRYGIIGPIPPERLEPEAIAKCIADNPLAKAAGAQARRLLGADQLHVRRHVLRRGGSADAAREERRPHPFR